MSNQINLIRPFLYLGTWVFTDLRVGLDHEPFVAGADLILDRITQPIEGAENGFSLYFSDQPFPDHQHAFTKTREELGGAWYKSTSLDMEGWLCPALLRYYPTPPDRLYVAAKAAA